MSKPFHELVAERLIEQLEKGTAPWQKPWTPGQSATSLPYNPKSGKRYKGINTLNLMAQGYDDPRWMTYEQAKTINAQVMKGERSTPVQYWKFKEEHKVLDSNGQPVLDANGQPKIEIVPLERPKVFFARVFNAQQIDGLPPLDIPPQTQEQSWDAIRRVEDILKASAANIHHVSQDKAFYRPSTDSIHLPEKNQFSEASQYYATALHELGHWTGHPTRLNRDLSHPFGSQGYAKEELRAEISSMILGEELGIGHNPEQHAAYVKSWISVLKEDPLEIFRAASDAEKIQSLVLSYEQQQTLVTALEDTLSLEAFESWRNYRYIAEELGLKAELITNDNRNEATPDYKITYTLNNIPQTFHTELFGHQGTAATYQSNQPVWGDHFSDKDNEWVSSPELQADALETAFRRMVLAYVDTEISKLSLEAPDIEAENLTRLSVAMSAVNDGHLPATALNIVGHSPAFLSQIENGLTISPKWNGDTFIVKPNQGKESEDARFYNDSDRYMLMLSESKSGKVWNTAANFNTLHEAQTVETLLKTAYSLSQEKAVNMSTPQVDTPQNKVFLSVPHSEKEQAKALGAKWDRQHKHWYTFESELIKFNGQWPIVKIEPKVETKLYLAVPYAEKTQAKALGAQWDKQQKSWYIEPGIDKKLFNKWLPENRPAEQAPAINPRDELALVMKEMGFELSGDHPIMDGEKHRCRLTTDKGSISDKSGSGMYVTFTDGIPAAYLSNNRTGETQNWSSKGYVISDAEKAALRADSARKVQAREQAQAEERQSVATGIQNLLEVCSIPLGNEKYLTNKQAQVGNLLLVPPPDALKDDPKVLIGANWKESKTLREENPYHIVFTAGEILIPAYDAQGNILTAQTIQSNGTKMFPKGSSKTGAFHVVGGDLSALAKAPTLIIAEGYATADTVSEAAAQPVVSAFDASNMIAVAKSLREKYPDKPILIAGDDDAHLVMTEGKNVGRDKAIAAAEAVNGIAIFPIFAPKEQHYPPELPIVTPSAWRENNVSIEQTQAINSMKGFTDFNDIKVKSVLGIDGVKLQVKTAIKQLIKNHKLQKELEQSQVIDQVKKTARVNSI
ncbi:domain of unknown function DUF1738 (plasmid) [Shewanella baltica OS195]|uniref:Toprim domain-containing protein n=1 Tax=Shewanella baltica (strain OS195) TaxID=399599 RepID=A9L6P1_SHEB9|nr:zincin-like metallopeptidase domain-containing protein [Shewanella baltica]ABX51823.1 domain of unknown function DUF1738 [Shewanella baltica OS195]